MQIAYGVQQLGDGIVRVEAAADGLACGWQGPLARVTPAWRLVYMAVRVRLEIYDEQSGVPLAWDERLHTARSA